MTAKYALLAFRRRKRKMKQKKEDKELYKVECQHIDGNLLLVAKLWRMHAMYIISNN